MSLRSFLGSLWVRGARTGDTTRSPDRGLGLMLYPHSFAHGLRGRVHRVNILTGGDTSVVLRFGIEEAGRARFRPGTVLEVRIVEVPPPPAPRQVAGQVEPDPVFQPVDTTPKFTPSDADLARAAEDASYPCNCGAINGRPHEPDCIWWQTRDALARQQRYDRILAEELEHAGLPPDDQLDAVQRQSAQVINIHALVVERLDAEDRQRRGET